MMLILTVAIIDLIITGLCALLGTLNELLGEQKKKYFVIYLNIYLTEA